jgi:hypothetical protein
MAAAAFSIPILDGVHNRLLVISFWSAFFFVCRLCMLIAG